MKQQSRNTSLAEKSRKKVSVKEKNLVLFNDDINTFDFVIESLIDVCQHEPEQAEQCSLIAHYNGRCPVKSGPPRRLKPLCQALSERGLLVSIE